ncbi:class I SAM-dependent methyltransferase [Nocardia yamanashiensis]|uniref:class I SAM-dependent methyltransferase n=1 Tax=Nocardia yamanashiensis TaxID=209247 RepID=UPI0038CDB2EC
MRVVNPVAARVLSTVAGQLGNPHGTLGKLTARILNRGNRSLIDAAVDAAEPGIGDAVADIGFGGGVGLSLLLARVGATGTVHGFDISPDMIARAASDLRGEIATGRLTVAPGSLTDLPLDDAALDAAITVNTVYFIPDLAPACTEFARVLRPKSRIVIGVNDPDGMAKAPFTRYGFTLRPVAEIRAALEAAGLEVEHRQIPDRPFTGHLLIGRRAG